MKDNRKDLRIRLPEHARQDFDASKLKAERELGMALRDNEYAARVLVHAIRQESKS